MGGGGVVWADTPALALLSHHLLPKEKPQKGSVSGLRDKETGKEGGSCFFQTHQPLQASGQSQLRNYQPLHNSPLPAPTPALPSKEGGPLSRFSGALEG